MAKLYYIERIRLAKSLCGDSLCAVRLQDFYSFVDDDAQIVSNICGTTLSLCPMRLTDGQTKVFHTAYLIKDHDKYKELLASHGYTVTEIYV